MANTEHKAVLNYVNISTQKLGYNLTIIMIVIMMIVSIM
jgi:hypothetical protein